MNWLEIIGLVLGSSIGSGWLINVMTLKSQKHKMDAEAKGADAIADKAQSEVKTSELDNVQEAIKIWREMAESLKAERDEYKQSYLEVSTHNAEMAKQMDKVSKELAKLNTINSKMVKLLDKITPDNLNEMVDKIKKCHESE